MLESGGFSIEKGGFNYVQKSLLAEGHEVSLDDLTVPRIGILEEVSSGSAFRLLGHTDRDSNRVGHPHPAGGIPMIDTVHRIMNLWQGGDKTRINTYLTGHCLREDARFKSVMQALIEMSPQGAKEKSLLETIISYDSNLLTMDTPNDTEQQLTIPMKG